MAELPELPRLPGVEDLGLNKVTDGPPVPKSWNIKWPGKMSEMMKKQWPGVPIPRELGERTMKRLPLGIGKGVLEVVDKLGL